MKRFLLLLGLGLILVLGPVQVFAAPAAQGSTYTVQPGDSLWRIATQFGTTPSAIQQANNLKSTTIYIGQVLVIPGANIPATAQPAQPTAAAATGGYVNHTVGPKDTLWNISRRYGTTVEAIQQANNMSNAVIHVGDVLKVPSNSAPTTPSQPTPATSTGQTGSTTGTVDYVVKGGDSLSVISRKYSVTVSQIRTANNLKSDLIRPGQVLKIPGQVIAQAIQPTAVPVQPTAAPVQPTAVPVQPTAAPVQPTAALPPTAIPQPQPTAALPPTAAPQPPPPPAASGLPASGGFALGGQVQGFGDNSVAAMKRAGMTWVKMQVRWSPGSNAGDQTGRIQDAHNKGFRVLLSVLGKPEDANANNFGEFARFNADLARNGADAIEIWNEMNLDREWRADDLTDINRAAASYVQMLSQSYQAIKGANGATTVISGALAPTGAFGGSCGSIGTVRGCDDAPYIRAMVANGALSYMDCLGSHYNEGIMPPDAASGDPRNPSNFYSRYYPTMTDTYFNAANGAKRICYTEVGYLSGEDYGGLPSAFGWAGDTSISEHAEWLARAAQKAATEGKVAMFIVFNVDITYYGDDPQAGFAMIRKNGSCPACERMGAIFGSR